MEFLYIKIEPFLPGRNALLVKLSDQGTFNKRIVNITNNYDFVK